MQHTGGLVVDEDEDGGSVIVPGCDVLPDGPLGEDGVHPSPRAVTVTAKLTVDTTVVAPQEVTVAFTQLSPSRVDEDSGRGPVPLGVLEFEDSDAEEDAEDFEDFEDAADELVTGRPHSSRL